MANLKKRPVKAEDLYDFQLIFTPRISPDGSLVVFSLQRNDRKTLKKFSNLWLAPADGSSPARAFTYGDQLDVLPRFSPDGTRIAFLSNRRDPEKPAQLYLIPLHGGEAAPLTTFPGRIEDFAWSPDGRKLVCVATKTDPENLQREQDEHKKKLGVVDRRYDRLFYKLDGFGYLPGERKHLWLVDARTGRMRQLTNHPVYDETAPCFSPDGSWIAFISNRSPEPDADLFAEDLWVMPSAGGDARRIPAPRGGKNLPSFSPDGKFLAYYSAACDKEEYKNRSLWVAAVDASTPPRNLTGEYDLHCTAWTINDLGQPEDMPPAWSPDGARLFFPALVHGSTVLHSVAVDGHGLQTIIAEGGVVGSFSFDVSGERMAFFYGRQEDPGQVFVREMKSGTTRQVTQVNRSLLDVLDLGKVEEVWFKGAAGNDLQGWILTPPGFDPGQKYPSILYIHGGPLTQYGKFFMHEFQYLAASGYVVVYCNPRGGRGYGEAHARAILGDWGNADYADLMCWADYVEKLPYIDPKRMGVAGGSYGGYMTVWIIGHTTRFAAACTQRCVSNFISEWGSSDYNYTFEQEIVAGPPFQDLQKYWDMSPIKYIAAAKTPTQVIHNENDLRCPIEQGEQVYVALKRLGVPTEMVRFPDEFHGLSRSGRTDRRIARLNHILRWFNGYLKK